MGEGLGEGVLSVYPKTQIPWHRALIARQWDFSARHSKPGRPPLLQEIARLIVRMARENPGWGYSRIRGALLHIGHRVARSTNADVLKVKGIEPSTRRVYCSGATPHPRAEQV